MSAGDTVLTEGQLQQLRESFDRWDTNGDGVLDKEEVLKAQSWDRDNDGQRRCDDCFAEMDTDQDGELFAHTLTREQ